VSTLEFARKCFSTQKLIDVQILNVLGLQVVRVILARIAVIVRRWRVPERSNPYARELAKRGCVMIENFLPDEEFQEVRREFERAFSDPELERTPPTVDRFGVQTQTPRIDVSMRDRYPATIRTFCDNERFLEIVRGHEGRTRGEYLKLGAHKLMFWDSRMASNTSAARVDNSNTDLHSDTFHTITKAFLYLDDIDAQNGAHRYVPGSHRLTLRRLWFEYLDSVVHKQAAPRIEDEEADLFGDGIRSFEAPANTLVMANEQGFHARGYFGPDGRRRVAYWEYRSHPFR